MPKMPQKQIKDALALAVMAKLAWETPIRKLNLGCGSALYEECVNLDRVQLPGVDVVHDLDEGPWPFDDNTFKQILGEDVFEHVNEPILFMTEAWRILVPNGTLWLKVPYFRHQDAFTDPTHKRFCTEHTFDYWIPGTALHDRHNPAYGGIGYELVKRAITAGSLFIQLSKLT